MAGRITSISVQKRNPTRLNVEINGSFALGLDRLVAAWLQIGQYVSDEEIAELKQKDTDEVLYQTAIRLIDYRLRSKAELQQRLIRKGYSIDQIQQVIERLEYSQLIDDRKFAEQWVDDRSLFHPRSRSLMSMEMRSKGIPSEIVQDVIETARNDESLAMDAGKKVLRRWQGLQTKEFNKSCTNFLARRGFSYDVIRAVLPDLWKEMQDLEKN